MVGFSIGLWSFIVNFSSHLASFMLLHGCRSCHVWWFGVQPGNVESPLRSVPFDSLAGLYVPLSRFTSFI